MRKIAAIALALALALGQAGWASAGDVTKQELVDEARTHIVEVSVERAKELLDAGGTLFIDCREPDEYAAGHVPGAVNIPRGLLEFKIAQRVPDKGSPIVTYCKTGGRGCLGCEAIVRLGYHKAVNMTGGWNAWKDKGYPTALAEGLSKQDLVAEAKARIRQVGVDEARSRLNDASTTFVDCREPGEYAAGHIPGAVNIPRGLVEFKIENIIKDKAARLIVYCKTGGRGSLTSAAIQRMGYTGVANLDGGWQAWTEAHCPAEAVETSDAPTATGPMTKKDLVAEAKARIKAVSASEAKAMWDQGGHYFFDCREEREYRAGHIPGALHVARGWLEFKIADLVPDRKASIVVYCRTGDRSSLGVLALKRMGYTGAVNLDGGWQAWDKAGYPVQ